MEEIEVTNQSDTPVVAQVATEPAQPETASTETPVTTQEPAAEPNGIKVKYNKEERVVSLDEAPNWIQKGMNYDKLEERVKEYETRSQQLDRVAKYAGYESHEDFLAAIDQAEREQAIKDEAAKLNVDESVIRDHLSPLKQQLQQYEQQLQDIKQQEMTRKINAEYASLKDQHPDVDNYWPRMVELSGKGFDLTEAYDIASYKDRLAGVQKQTEAETIKKLQQNANSSPGSLGQEGSTHKTGFAALTPDQQREVIEKVKRGEIRSLDQIT